MDYFLIFIIIFLALSYFYYSIKTVVKVDIVEKKTVIVESEKKEIQQEVLLHLNTDFVKYNFYNLDTFYSRNASNLYTKLVVRTLWIEEPYHSTFVKVLQIINKTESWIRSNNTKIIKLKIRQNNGSFQKGTSFKVYSLSSISFEFANRVLTYFIKKRSTKINIQTTIFAVLLYHADKIQEIQYLCSDNIDISNVRGCLVKKILGKYQYKDEVILLLEKMEDRDASVIFLLNIYDEFIKFEREFS